MNRWSENESKATKLAFEYAKSNFDKQIQTMLRDELADSRPSIIGFIIVRIRTLNLHHSGLDPYEVFHEAYLRAITLLEKGEVIHNPYGWLKKVSSYIIYEAYRSNKRDKKIFEKAKYDFCIADEKDSCFDKDISNKIENLNSLLSKVSEFDRAILLLKNSGRTWNSIAEEMIENGSLENGNGDLEKTIVKLRKRYSRALKKIKDSI